MTLLSSGESGDPCGVPSSQPVSHDARFQVGPDQPEHLLVVGPSGDPCHQGVVLNAIEKRVEIKIDAPRRVISDELACPLDSVMLRAPRAEPEAVGMGLGVETGVSTCAIAWQINRSTAAGTPSIRRAPEGLGIITLLTGCGRYVPASSCERICDQWSFNHGRSSFVLIPSMPGAPAFCSTRLSASARFPRAGNCSHKLASAG
jgi:hypothetical protein